MERTIFTRTKSPHATGRAGSGVKTACLKVSVRPLQRAELRLLGPSTRSSKVCPTSFLFAAGVEQVGDLLRVVPAGDAVARAVVEDVAEQDHAVGLKRVDVFEKAFQRAGYAVDIGEEEQFHAWKPFVMRQFVFSSETSSP